MLSSSADPNPQESVILERRTAALEAFDSRVPAIYEERIPLPPKVADWVAGWGGSSLFLTGSIGVGKTHTAWQTCRSWLDAWLAPSHPRRARPSIEAFRSTALFDALRPDAHDNSGRALVKHLQTVDLLFIDDLAAARPSSWTQERLFEIFDERYINRRPVIITCDVLPNALSEITSERVASRLAEMCGISVIRLAGRDRRIGGEAA